MRLNPADKMNSVAEKKHFKRNKYEVIKGYIWEWNKWQYQRKELMMRFE